ncbi:hypothetical protein GF356_09230 [candidate division GN15 bacterium]|nr:hypothetical protein [candidate division GN15 bacterium]
MARKQFDNQRARVLNFGPRAKPSDNTGEAMKFVVLDHDGRLVLIHGPLKEYPYHASLIHEYCESYEVPAAWLKKPDLIEVFDDDVEIRGGGWLEFDDTGRKLSIYGFSTAYGKYVTSDIEHILQSTDSFTGYRITLKG